MIETIDSFDSPFLSLSNPSLHDFFGEGPTEQSNLHTATPVHDPTPTRGSLDFLDQPRAQVNSSVSRNMDPDYAYLFMSRKEMTTPEYSGARHDVIRREQSRRAKVPHLA